MDGVVKSEHNDYCDRVVGGLESDALVDFSLIIEFE